MKYKFYINGIMTRIYNRKELTERRKELRNNATQAEQILWDYLKKSKIKGYKFRRQHSISNYILDFYCPEKKLAIELDGKIHSKIEQKQYDENRTDEIAQFDIKIIRFENDEILHHIEKVLETIEKELT